MIKGGGIRYGRSYGAESVENAELAMSKRGSSEMNGTKSNLPYALGVSLRVKHSFHQKDGMHEACLAPRNGVGVPVSITD
jgi:hypothetical protein